MMKFADVFRKKEVTQEVSQEAIKETELREFTEAMKQKMAEQGLSYTDLANINLNKAVAGVKEEISKLEKNIEVLNNTGANDLRSVYPFIKRRQEIIDAKTKRLLQLQKDYEVSPDLYGAAQELDHLEMHNRGIVLFLRACDGMDSVYSKFAIATECIAAADGYVGPEFTTVCNNLATVVRDLKNNRNRMNYKSKSDIEVRFFTALKRDDEMFNSKISVLNSVNEYKTILEEPTEAISRNDMKAYDDEFLKIQAIIATQEKGKTASGPR